MGWEEGLAWFAARGLVRSGQLGWLLGGVLAVGALTLLAANAGHRSWTRRLRTRGAVVGLGVLWALFCVADYLVPPGAPGRPDEFNLGIPWLLHRARQVGESRYAAGWSGGVDAEVGVMVGTSWASLESRAFDVLSPRWGLLGLKIGAVGLAFAGGVALGRRAGELSWPRAALVGLLATAHVYHFAWPVGLGFGPALACALFWSVVLRSADKGYFAVVFGVSCLFAAASSPIHSLPSTLVGVFAASILRPPERPLRALGGAFVCVGTVLSWHAEVFFAIAQVAPESARAGVVAEPLSIAASMWSNTDVLSLPIGLLGVLWLAARGDPWARRGAAALLVVWSLGWVLPRVDWVGLSLAPVAAYRFDLLLDGQLVVCMVVASRVVQLASFVGAEVRGFRTPSWLFAYLVGVPVVFAANQRALARLELRGYGSQRVWDGLACLPALPRLPRTRVVTLPSLVAPNTVEAYGLETFDGSANQFSRRQHLYFTLGVLAPEVKLQGVRDLWLQVTSEQRTLAKTVRLEALAAANVGYVVSDRRLDDSRLGPPTCTYGEPSGNAGSEDRSVDVPPHLVYALEGAWPRAFAPSAVRLSRHDLDDRRFYGEVFSEPLRALVAASDVGYLQDDAALHAGAFEAGEVGASEVSVESIVDGYRLRVDPDPEVVGPTWVVVNAPYSRHFRAHDRRGALSIVPVNGVHMMFRARTAQTVVRYERPRLRELFTSRRGQPTLP